MSLTLISVTVVLATLLHARSVDSFSDGAPSFACDSLTPNPNAHEGPPQNTTVPYSIDLSPFNGGGNLSYTPGNTYALTLSGNNEEQFKGVFIQARLVADDTSNVGSFSVVDEANSKLSACTPANAGITHSNADNKTSVSFRWTAPPEGTGAIRFGFSVVEVRATYWANERTFLIPEGSLDPFPTSPSTVGDSGTGNLMSVSFWTILMVAMAVVFKGTL